MSYYSFFVLAFNNTTIMAKKVTQRKKPTQKRSRETVACVLEAATQILETVGLPGYNTNAVAARAGISIGSLYQYFPGKESITLALIEASHEHIIKVQKDTLNETQGQPLSSALNTLLTYLIELHTGPKHQLIRILELEEERLPSSAQLTALETEIEQLNQIFFSRYINPKACSKTDLEHISRDTICVVRAMFDTAAQRNLLDDPHLLTRLHRMLSGYLQPFLL